MVFKIKVDELSYLFHLISGPSLSQITSETENQLSTLKNGAASNPSKTISQPISEYSFHFIFQKGIVKDAKDHEKRT
jgi:hypothetical protein